MSRASETRRVPTQASWRRRVLRALSVLVGLGALGIGIVFLRPDWAEKIANGLRAALGPSFVARIGPRAPPPRWPRTCPPRLRSSHLITRLRRRTMGDGLPWWMTSTPMRP